MKHHQFMQGWREANDMQPGEFRRELLAMACSYLLVMGIVSIVVWQLAR